MTVFGSVVLYGCCKEECIKDGSLWVSYQNYQHADVDTVALVSYRKGTTELIDTTWQYSPSVPTDTSWANVSSRLDNGVDWKIHIPAVNKTFLVTDIMTASSECSCERGRSYYVHGFKVNNTEEQGSVLIL